MPRPLSPIETRFPAIASVGSFAVGATVARFTFGERAKAIGACAGAIAIVEGIFRQLLLRSEVWKKFCFIGKVSVPLLLSTIVCTISSIALEILSFKQNLLAASAVAIFTLIYATIAVHKNKEYKAIQQTIKSFYDRLTELIGSKENAEKDSYQAHYWTLVEEVFSFRIYSDAILKATTELAELRNYALLLGVVFYRTTFALITDFKSKHDDLIQGRLTLNSTEEMDERLKRVLVQLVPRQDNPDGKVALRIPKDEEKTRDFQLKGGQCQDIILQMQRDGNPAPLLQKLKELYCKRDET